MKTLYITMILAIIGSGIQAQQLPNNSFETWNNDMGQEEPNSYFSFDALSGTDLVSKSTDAHNGSFAVKLNTTYMTPDTTIVDSAGIPIDTLITDNSSYGLLLTGDWSTFSFGLPFTSRPEKLRIWAKVNTLPAGDTAGVILFFTKHNVTGDSADIVGGTAIGVFGPAGNWAMYEADIEYTMPDNPDTVMMYLSSNFGDAHGDAEIIFDDVEFIYGSVAVNEINTYDAVVYPNPGNGNLTVRGNGLVGSELRVTDVAGRTLSNVTVTADQTRLTIETPGMYFVTAIAANGEVVLRTKVSVQ